MDRRGFLSAGAAGMLGVFGNCARLGAQEPARGGIPYGQSPLGLSDDGRDGMLYVPKGYRDGAAAPLLVMLHGFGGWADEMRSSYALAEEFGVIMIVPESRGITWGQTNPGFDSDVRYIGAAYRKVREMFDLDPVRVGLAGRSDGAGYALSMGLAYGDVFNHVIVFSGGLMAPARRKGKPRIFISHGTNDRQMPIDLTGRKFSKILKDEGYDVTYREYEGGHGTPSAVAREAFVWFVGREPQPR